jgi:hypothetical protein
VIQAPMKSISLHALYKNDTVTDNVNAKITEITMNPKMVTDEPNKFSLVWMNRVDKKSCLLQQAMRSLQVTPTNYPSYQISEGHGR